MDEKRQMLCHFLAAIAYRTQKALRQAPVDFATFRAVSGLRTPWELLLHMTSVLGYARTHLQGGVWRPESSSDFESEVARLHEILEDLRCELASDQPLIETTPERLLQGPLADAMSHAGQLSMLRRLHGSPVPPENFIVADIDSENLSVTQADPVSPDAEWYDAEGNIQSRRPTTGHKGRHD
jgi:hypothetical protein